MLTGTVKKMLTEAGKKFLSKNTKNNNKNQTYLR